MSDRYEIQDKIGQGGIGAVYRAYDTQLKRSVAIKRMLSSDAEVEGKEASELMLKEATTLSALQHPNIITVYDVGVDAEGPFVVMELLKGETLDQVIKRGVLTLKDFGEVVSQTMEALVAAGAAGVLHRDLKPTNVMVSWLPSKKFQVKILDFSLAKFSRTPSPQTIDQGDAIFGSIYFMAPEQFERGNLDQRTDLYSMGCLYYFCLSGQYPFQGETAAQVMASHLQGSVKPIEKIRSDLPPMICQWVMWLINRNAENRPQDAREAFENYQQIAQNIDLKTGKVNLNAAPSENTPLHTTSRRLIVPSPKKTGAVPVPPPKAPAAGKAESSVSAGSKPGGGSLPKSIPATGRLTGPVQVAQRKGPTVSYLVVILLILAVVAGGLGVQLWVKHYQSEKSVRRFEALMGQSVPVGSGEDVNLCVRYLDGIDSVTTGAKVTLHRMQDIPGEEGSVDAALIEALRSATSVRTQQNLLEILRLREIHTEEELLLSMASSEFDPKVTERAMQLLGDFGDRAVFEKLLATFNGESEANVPPYAEQALKAMGERFSEGDRESAAAGLVAVLETRSGSIRIPMLRLLGGLGGEQALEALTQALQREGDSDEAKADRMTALQALSEWPTRQPAVEALLRTAWEGEIRHVALGAYLLLALRPGGEDLPQREMIDRLWTELRTDADKGEWNLIRLRLIQALPRLDDQSLAARVASEMAASNVLDPVVKREARAMVGEIQS